MGAACGKGHSLNEDNTPYAIKDPPQAPPPNEKAKPDDEGANGVEEVVEEDVKQDTEDCLKTEVRPSAIKVQFPEQQNIQSYIDPEKATASFDCAFDCATIAPQKCEFFNPSDFQYIYGLKCCASNLPLTDSCTVIFGFTFHPQHVKCSVSGVPLTGPGRKSDITISKTGQLFCDQYSHLALAGTPYEQEQTSNEENGLENGNDEEDEFLIISAGRKWKPADLKCSVTGLPLSKVTIYQDGKLYSPEAYKDTVAPQCHLTGKKIVGRCLRIGEQVYQLDSVKCPKCNFKICDNDSVYIREGFPPELMDCSKGVSSLFYKTTTDDEAGIFSAYEDNGSDSDREYARRGFNPNVNSASAVNTQMDMSSYSSSINTSFSSLPYPRHDRPESTIPAMYRPKTAGQYLGSYLKPERESSKTATHKSTGNVTNFATLNGTTPDHLPPQHNGTSSSGSPQLNGGPKNFMQNGKVTTAPGKIQNGSVAAAPKSGFSSKLVGLPSPRKINSSDFVGPLAPVYYKKDRESRRLEQERKAKAKSEVLNGSLRSTGGAQNGRTSSMTATNGGDQHSPSSAARVQFNGGNSAGGDRVNSSLYDGDVSNRMDGTLDDSVDFSSSQIQQTHLSNGTKLTPSPTEANTSGIGSEQDTDVEMGGGGVYIPKRGMESDGDVTTDVETDYNAEVTATETDGGAVTEDEGRGGYVTEDDIDRMESGLGKEILREIKMQMDANNAKDDPVEVQYVPDDPIKASRSPDAKTEVQLPYFCEIKFGPIATGINRYCDSWLLEQATREPMSQTDYSNFMRGFQRFTNASSEYEKQPWKNSTTNNSLISDGGGAMSDTEGMRRYTAGVGTGPGGRSFGAPGASGYRSDGYKSEGGYCSSPEMTRRKMNRYNSLDVRKAWYHERFLTYVQMYHKKGNLLFEQQKEACMQHIRKSMGSLAKSHTDLKVYPKERLMTNLNKRLPEDVNRSRMELHLSDEEFVEMFAMTQDQFRCLPHWKQNVLKQLNYLF